MIATNTTITFAGCVATCMLPLIKSLHRFLGHQQRSTVIESTPAKKRLWRALLARVCRVGTGTRSAPFKISTSPELMMIVFGSRVSHLSLSSIVGSISFARVMACTTSPSIIAWEPRANVRAAVVETDSDTVQKKNAPRLPRTQEQSAFAGYD